MADEVLRMRATVSSEEALANIRAIGKEFGLLPQKAKPPIDQLNTSFRTLGGTIARIGQELRAAVPALGGFGFGAAGVGLAAGALVRSLSGIADKIVQLKYASQELGLAENVLRGFTSTAEKAGIAPEAMLRALQTFNRNANEFRLNIGNLRLELYGRGGGDLVTSIARTKDPLKQLELTFARLKALQQTKPFEARMLAEQLFGTADVLRFTFDEVRAAYGRLTPLTDAQIAQAKQFRDSLIDLGTAWNDLTQKAGIALFPQLKNTLAEVQQIIAGLDWITKHLPGGDKGDVTGGVVGAIPKPHLDLLNPDSPARRALRAPAPQFTAPGGVNPLLQMPGGGSLGGGYSPIAFREGFDTGNALTEFSRAVKDGVFAALVEFSSYAQGGTAGGTTGFQRATFTVGGAPAGTSTGGGNIAIPGGGGFNGGGAAPSPAASGGGDQPQPNLTPGTGGGTAGGGAAGGGFTPVPRAGGFTPIPRGAMRGDGAPAPPSAGSNKQASLPPGGGVPSGVPATSGGELGPAAALAIARRHLGEHEIADQTKLSQFFRDQGIRVNPRTVPWCAAFVNAGLKAAGIKGTGSLAAGSFTNYGTAVPMGEVQPGDIGVVRGRSPRTGIEGRHVGFLTGETRMVNGRLQYKMVAGNERDGVRETWRDARSLHTRRPPAPEGGRAVASTDRIDSAVAPPKVSAEGRVNVTVTSNGTAAKTDATSEGMFQETTVVQRRQMAPTDMPAGVP